MIRLDNTTGDASRVRKLSSADARRIRELNDSGLSQKEIRLRYYPHVSHTCISRVVRRKNWNSA